MDFGSARCAAKRLGFGKRTLCCKLCKLEPESIVSLGAAGNYKFNFSTPGRAKGAEQKAGQFSNRIAASVYYSKFLILLLSIYAHSSDSVPPRLSCQVGDRSSDANLSTTM